MRKLKSIEEIMAACTIERMQKNMEDVFDEFPAKLYVVNTVSCDGYDSWESSYHLTRKGALKFIIDSQYRNWELCPYGYSCFSYYG